MTWSNALFHKNRRLLAQVADPRIPNALVDVAFPPQSLTTDGQNLVLTGQALYPSSYQNFCKEQAEAYIKAPKRISIESGARTVERGMQLATTIASQIEAAGDKYLSRHPGLDIATAEPLFRDAGALISFGLGIGGHLPLLANELEFSNLIIVEPELDFLIASLGIVDWEPIVTHLNDQAGQLYFILDNDPAQAMALLTAILRDRPFAGLEGTFFYTHYASSFLEGLKNRLHEYGPNLLTYNGWIEDDVLHVRNHAANTLSSEAEDAFLLDPATTRSSVRKAGPAVISGSGPSLMNEAALLRQARDGYTLFSAGTSIGALLSHGLRPDFHCELENVSVVGDFLKKTDEIYGLDDITLIASTTVDPSLQGFFKDRVYFVREGDGLIRLATGKIGQMSLVGPSAVNAALSIARFLGHGPIFLIGADFGAVDQNQGYSKGVLYESINEINQKRSERGEGQIGGAGSTHDAMTVNVAGSRGNMVYSNPLLISMRHRLEEQLGLLDAAVFNLGDGARIEGAPYCAHQDFLNQCKTDSVSLTSKEVTETTSQPMRPLCKTDLPDKEDLAAIGERIDEYVEGFHDALDGLTSKVDMNSLTSVDLLNAVSRYLPSATGSLLHPEREVDPIAAAFEGSMMRIFHVIRHVEARFQGEARTTFVMASLNIWRAFRDVWSVVTSDRLRHRLAHVDDVGAAAGRENPTNPLHAILLGDVPIEFDHSLLDALRELRTKSRPLHNSILIKALSRLRRGGDNATVAAALYAHFFDCVTELPAPGPALDVILNALCFSYEPGSSDIRLLNLLDGIPVESINLSNRQRMCLANLYARVGGAETCRHLAQTMRACATTVGEMHTAANYLTIAGEVRLALDAFAMSEKERTAPPNQLDLKGIALALTGEVQAASRHYRTVLGRDPGNADDFAVPFDFLIRRHGLTEARPAITGAGRGTEYAALCEIAYRNAGQSPADTR